MSDFTIDKDASGAYVLTISNDAIVYMGDDAPYYYYSGGYYVPFTLDDGKPTIDMSRKFVSDEPGKIDNLLKVLQAMSDPVQLVLSEDPTIIEQLPDIVKEEPVVVPEASVPEAQLAQVQVVIDVPEEPPVISFTEDPELDQIDDLEALFAQQEVFTNESVGFGAMRFTEINVKDMIKFLPILYPNMDPIVAEKYVNVLLGLIRRHNQKQESIGERLLKRTGLPSWLVPLVSATMKIKPPSKDTDLKTFAIPQPPLKFFDRLAEGGYEASPSREYIHYHVSEPVAQIDHIDSTGMFDDKEDTPLSWLNCRQDYTINVAQQTSDGVIVRRTYGDETDLNVIMYADYVTTRAQSIAEKGAIKSVTCSLIAPGDDIYITGFLQNPIGSNTWSSPRDYTIHPIKQGLKVPENITSFYPTPQRILTDIHRTIVERARNMAPIRKLLASYMYTENDLEFNSIDRSAWNAKFAKPRAWPQDITVYHRRRTAESHTDQEFVADYTYLPADINRERLLVLLNSTPDYGTTYHLLRMKKNMDRVVPESLKLHDVQPSVEEVGVYTLQPGKIGFALPGNSDDDQDRGFYYSLSDYVKLVQNNVIRIYNENVEYRKEDIAQIDERIVRARNTLTFLTKKSASTTKGSILKSIVVKLATDYLSTSSVVRTFETLSKDLTAANRLTYVSLLDQYVEYNMISFDKDDGFYRDALNGEIICCMHFRHQLKHGLDEYVEDDVIDFIETVEGVTRCKYCHIEIIGEVDKMPQFAGGALNLIHTYRDMILGDMPQDSIDTMTELYIFLEFMTDKLSTVFDLPPSVKTKIIKDSYSYIASHRSEAIDPYFMYGNGQKYQEIVEIIIANSEPLPMFEQSKKTGRTLFTKTMKFLLSPDGADTGVSPKLSQYRSILNSFLFKFQKDTAQLQAALNEMLNGPIHTTLTELHNAFILPEHAYRLGVLLAHITYHNDMYALQTNNHFSTVSGTIDNDRICELLTDYHKRRTTILKSWKIDILSGKIDKTQQDRIITTINTLIDLVRYGYNPSFIRAANKLIPYNDGSASAYDHAIKTGKAVYRELQDTYAEQYAQIVVIEDEKETLPHIWHGLPFYQLPYVAEPSSDDDAYTQYITSISHNRYAGQRYLESMRTRGEEIVKLLSDTQINYPISSNTASKASINEALVRDNIVPTTKGETLAYRYPKSGLAYFGSLFSPPTDLMVVPPTQPSVKTLAGSERFDQYAYVPYKENIDLLDDIVNGLSTIAEVAPAAVPNVRLSEIRYNLGLTMHTEMAALTPKYAHIEDIRFPGTIRDTDSGAFVEALTNVLIAMTSSRSINVIDADGTIIDFGTLITGSLPRDIDVNKNLIKRWEDISYLKSYPLDKGCTDMSVQSILLSEKTSVTTTKTQRSFHKIRCVGKQMQVIHQWLSKKFTDEDWAAFVVERDAGEQIMHETIFEIKGTKEGVNDLSGYMLDRYVPFSSALYTASIEEYKRALVQIMSGQANTGKSYGSLSTNPRDDELRVVEQFAALFDQNSSFEVMYINILGTAIKLDILRQMYIIDNMISADSIITVSNVSRITGTRRADDRIGSHDYLTNIVKPIIQQLLDDNLFLDPNHEEFVDMLYRDFYARVAAPKTASSDISKMLKKGDLGIIAEAAGEEGEDDGVAEDGEDGELGEEETGEDGEILEETVLEDNELDDIGNTFGGEEED